jgi:hypothetical protein
MQKISLPTSKSRESCRLPERAAHTHRNKSLAAAVYEWVAITSTPPGGWSSKAETFSISP